MDNSTQKQISISSKVYEQIEKRVGNTEFKSVSEYTEYVLKQVLAKTTDGSDQNVYNKEEEDQVKARLKGLGYLQ